MDTGIYSSSETQWLDSSRHYQQNPRHYGNPLDHRAKSKKSRGNLPREAVDYLMTWLYENRFRAYPCEETKKKMARHTGLTLQQVNNWYINARRRILPSLITKEGKEPRDYRITRKRTNPATTTTTPTIFNNTTAATSPTPTVSPASSIVSDSSPHPSPNLLTSPITRFASPTYSPVALMDGHSSPGIAPVFPPPSASPSPMSQQRLYGRSEYFLNTPSSNCSMSFNNDCPSGACGMALARSSRGVPVNNCLIQSQSEPLSTIENPTPYNYYNLVYNNDREHNESLLPVENPIRSRYGTSDGKFRILEFNMI